jgi:hypothetical protein
LSKIKICGKIAFRLHSLTYCRKKRGVFSQKDGEYVLKKAKNKKNKVKNLFKNYFLKICLITYRFQVQGLTDRMCVKCKA